MKKTTTLIAVVVLGLLASSFVGIQLAKADSQTNAPFFSGINIISPSNTTYSSRLLTLNVSVATLGGSDIKILMNYSLDGFDNNTIIPTLTQYLTGSIIIATHTGVLILSSLNEGSHNITVYLEYNYPNNNMFVTPFPGTITQFYNSTVHFTINDGAPPVISILSLENQTFAQNNLLLNFTTDEPTSWVGYCLDGQANVTVAGNTTIPKLPNGLNNLTIYANDTVGNMGMSKTINFDVSPLLSLTPSSSPTIPEFTPVAVLILAAAACLFAVAFRKRR